MFKAQVNVFILCVCVCGAALNPHQRMFFHYSFFTVPPTCLWDSALNVMVPCLSIHSISCFFPQLIRYHMWERWSDACLFLTELFHWAECSPGPHMLCERVRESSFLVQHGMPWYKSSTTLLSRRHSSQQQVFRNLEIGLPCKWIH